MIGEGHIIVGRVSVKSLEKSLGLSLNENVVYALLKGTRISLRFISPRIAEMTALCFISIIGSNIVSMTVSACKSGFNSQGIAGCIEITNGNCEAIILVLKCLNCIKHTVYLVLSCFVGLVTIIFAFGISTHPPKVS